jgi:hypothetical protein
MLLEEKAAVSKLYSHRPLPNPGRQGMRSPCTLFLNLHSSQRFWETLAHMYLKESESPPLAKQNSLAIYLVARSGVPSGLDQFCFEKEQF